MAGWIDFKSLRASVSLEDVLTGYYGITTLTVRGDKLTGPCPVHGGDSPRAFSADFSRNVWFCFTKCRDGGNQLDLVAKKEGITIREAALRLQAWLDERKHDAPPLAPAPSTPPRPARGQTGRGKERPKAAGREPGRKVPVPTENLGVETLTANPVLDLHLALGHDHPHLLETRGLQLATMQHFDVGYCRKGILRGMIAIPVHNKGGELVAYAGRRLKPEQTREKGRYKLPSNFRRSVELFNLHRVMALDSPGPVAVVEGFFSVLQLHEVGIPAVATMGTQVSDEQCALLHLLPEIMVLFDGDEAGDLGARELFARLQDHPKVRLVELPAGFEPEQLPVRALRWLVAGMSQLDLRFVSLRGPTSDIPAE